MLDYFKTPECTLCICYWWCFVFGSSRGSGLHMSNFWEAYLHHKSLSNLSCNIFYKFQDLFSHCVATLALGLRPRQGGCKVVGQKGDPGVTSHAPGSAKSVRA